VSGGYPVLLELRELPLLVVGGGAVALRRVRGLLEAGGRPRLVSPALHPELAELVRSHGLDWAARPFQPGDVGSAALVFATTDQPGVNAAVAAEAAAGGALVNRADAGEGSSFQLPAVLRQDPVLVAVSTGGASPLLARRLRERLEAVVTPALGRAARRLAALRREVAARWPADEGRRRALWMELITPEFMDAAIAGHDREVEQHISRCLSQS
jgi:siroheme synthase-like protein